MINFLQKNSMRMYIHTCMSQRALANYLLQAPHTFDKSKSNVDNYTMLRLVARILSLPTTFTRISFALQACLSTYLHTYIAAIESTHTHTLATHKIRNPRGRKVTPLLHFTLIDPSDRNFTDQSSRLCLHPFHLAPG